MKNKPVSDVLCNYRLYRTAITDCFHQIEIDIADLRSFSSFTVFQRDVAKKNFRSSVYIEKTMRILKNDKCVL